MDELSRPEPTTSIACCAGPDPYHPITKFLFSTNKIKSLMCHISWTLKGEVEIFFFLDLHEVSSGF